MKKYLVTGGAGFIGTSIVKKLVKEGNKVRVFDNQSRGSQMRLLNLGNNLEFFHGDIRSLDHVEKAASGIDSIIHLAYINGTKYFYSQPDLVLEVAIKGIINILSASKKHKVKEFFLASSSEVYNKPRVIPTPEKIPMYIPDSYNPRFSYGGGKIISELYTIHFGSTFLEKVVIFRPHNVYGPAMGFEHVIPEIISKCQKLQLIKSTNNEISIQGTGKESRAFIYIEDFTEALYLLLNKANNLETYNIGVEKETTIKELVFTLSKILNIKLTILPSPLQKGSVSRRCPNINKIKSLGFSPTVSLEDGLKKTISWYKKYLIESLDKKL